MNNAGKVKLVVENILEQYGLPKELFYVGLIESGYNTFIKSHAKATGPWQFMKATGRRYGLIVNSSIDERYNLEKSTEAAARYFLDLYNIFGGWELALCAYNSGEYKVIRAIRKGNTRNLNELIAKKLLPRETRNYVPKLMAARELVRNYQKYGFSFREAPIREQLPSYEIAYDFDLRKLSRSIGVSSSLIKQVNPEIKTRYIDVPKGKIFEIHLPGDSLGKVTKKAVAYSRSRSPRRKTQANRGNVYVVKKGENLTQIADRFEISLASLLKANRLRINSTIHPGQKLFLKADANRVSYHRVRKGDNLSSLARRYGLSMNQLKADNRLSGSRIYVGQRLRVRKSQSKAGRRYRVYRVKRGDTLFDIARRFKTSVKEIKRVNSMKKSLLVSNTTIKIPVHAM